MIDNYLINLITYLYTAVLHFSRFIHLYDNLISYLLLLLLLKLSSKIDNYVSNLNV